MIDIDHFGEIGHRLGIANPESYIIGRPLEVKDIGGKRTSVVGEIRRAANGVHNPALNKYDMIWDALSSKPPIEYRASVYGFPKAGSVIDCRNNSCDSPATRFHIKAMDWKSLALTRSPVNTKIKGSARIVKASAFLFELAKSLNMHMPDFESSPPSPNSNNPNGSPFDAGTNPESSTHVPPAISPSGAPGSSITASQEGPSTPLAAPLMLSQPRNMSDALGQHLTHISRDCEHSGGLNTTLGFKSHFIKCCGMPPDSADVWAHALMHAVLLHGRRK